MVERIAGQLKIAAKDKSVSGYLRWTPRAEKSWRRTIFPAPSSNSRKNAKPVIASLSGLAASRILCCRSLSVDRRQRNDHHREHRRDHAQFQLSWFVGQGRFAAPSVQSGKFKDMLSGSRRVEEIDPKEVEMIQEMIDETYNRFKKVVENGRGRQWKKNKGNGKRLDEIGNNTRTDGS